MDTQDKNIELKNSISLKSILATWGPIIAVFVALFAFYVVFNWSLINISNNVNSKLMDFKGELGRVERSVTMDLAEFKAAGKLNNEVTNFGNELAKLPQTIIEQIQKIQLGKPQKLDDPKQPNPPSQ